MDKKPRRGPLLGFNNNVNWKGVVYHVQTEDSGLDRPHIITHLFTGGNILATKKTSYADLVDDPDVDEKVRKMMRDQHKNMFLALRDGTHEEYAKKDMVPRMPADLQDHAEKAVARAKSPPAATSISHAARAAAVAPRATRASGVTKSSIRKAVEDGRGATRKSIPVPVEQSVPSVPRPTGASKRDSIPTLRRSSPAVPMPGSKAPDTATATGQKLMPVKPEGRPTASDHRPSPPPPVSRPKSIFTEQAKENEGFGEDLISERSLDEVILGFLDDDDE